MLSSRTLLLTQQNAYRSKCLPYLPHLFTRPAYVDYHGKLGSAESRLRQPGGWRLAFCTRGPVLAEARRLSQSRPLINEYKGETCSQQGLARSSAPARC